MFHVPGFIDARIFSHYRIVSIRTIIPAGCVLYDKCGQLFG